MAYTLYLKVLRLCQAADGDGGQPDGARPRGQQQRRQLARLETTDVMLCFQLSLIFSASHGGDFLLKPSIALIPWTRTAAAPLA